MKKCLFNLVFIENRKFGMKKLINFETFMNTYLLQNIYD